MDTITFRELQRLPAKELVERLPLIVTVGGKELIQLVKPHKEPPVEVKTAKETFKVPNSGFKVCEKHGAQIKPIMLCKHGCKK